MSLLVGTASNVFEVSIRFLGILQAFNHLGARVHGALDPDLPALYSVSFHYLLVLVLELSASCIHLWLAGAPIPGVAL